MPPCAYPAPEAQPGQPDFTREISIPGIQEARQAGSFVKTFNLPIDLILSSTAVRAHQTAHHLAEILEFNLDKLISSQELYYPTANSLLQILTKLPETLQAVILVSHNPAVSELVSNLTGSKVYVPTAGCSLFTSEANDWEALEWSDFQVKKNY